jgi:ribose transport system substrate-binding protein
MAKDKRTLTRHGFLQRVAAMGVAAGGGGVLLAACGDDGGSGGGGDDGDSGGGGRKEIAFSHVNSDATLVTSVRAAADERAAELGYKMLHDNTTQSNLEQQLSAVQTWLTQQVPAICLLPAEVAALKPFVAEAKAAGIVVTTYAFEMEEADGAVSFDAVPSGTIAAEHAVKWIKENGDNHKVLILTWTPLHDLAPRWEIPEKMIKEQTNATIVGKQDAIDPAKGLQITETVLQAHPDLSMVVSAVDDPALGSLQAFENAGKDPKTSYISGQDGNIDALKAIKKGSHYKASAAMSVKDIGYGIVDLNAGLIEGKLKAPHVLKIPFTLASLEDPKNLDRLLAQWG